MLYHARLTVWLSVCTGTMFSQQHDRWSSDLVKFTFSILKSFLRWNEFKIDFSEYIDRKTSYLSKTRIMAEKIHHGCSYLKNIVKFNKKIISRFCRIHPKMTQMKPFMTFLFGNDLFSVEIWFRISKIWSKICHMNSRSVTIADKKSIF